MTVGQVAQLGYAVSDLEPWVEGYLAAGVGPWWVSRDMAPQRFEYRAAPSRARFDVAISFSGDLMIEVIQPLDEHPSPYRTFLEGGREGLQHLAFFPDDPEAWIAQVEAAGYRTCLDGASNGFHFTYFESPLAGGDTLELGRLSGPARSRLADLRAICAAWDGRDALRTR